VAGTGCWAAETACIRQRIRQNKRPGFAFGALELLRKPPNFTGVLQVSGGAKRFSQQISITHPGLRRRTKPLLAVPGNKIKATKTGGPHPSGNVKAPIYQRNQTKRDSVYKSYRVPDHSSGGRRFWTSADVNEAKEKAL
jgi:hypothetical protein